MRRRHRDERRPELLEHPFDAAVSMHAASVSPDRNSECMDRSAAEDWIRAYVKPISAIETAHERPLSTVLRVRRSTATRSSGCAPSPRFDELAAHGIPETIQHDDLHMANLYAQGGRLRVLDWGDSSISHPFASLVVTFRFLEEINKLSPVDPWFARLRDAYLEPWGRNLTAVFDL